MDSITPLVHLAWQFGPFAFSLIFLIGLAMWGSKQWQQVITRASPPATDDEKNTYRRYFIAMSTVGVVLVGISVYWWWTHRPMYFYEGEIQGLSETDSVEGSALFVRNEYYRQDPSSPQFRDVYFLIRQAEPFTDGQEITLRYFRDRRLAKPVVLKVALDARYVMALEYDGAKDQWELIRRTRLPSTSFSLIAPAFAQSTKEIVPASASPAISIPAADDTSFDIPNIYIPSTDAIFADYAVELQDPKTLVSRKVEVLDWLRIHASRTNLSEMFELRPSDWQGIKEPIFLTLLDLTRHTDKEIANKANILLARAPLPTNYFYEVATSGSSTDKAEAINDFLRLEPHYAEAVVKSLAARKVDVRAYTKFSEHSDDWKQLIPTGTASGDRYYMNVDWDTKNYDCVYKQLSAIVNAKTATKEWKPPEKSPWLVFATDKTQIVKAYDQ